MHMPEAECVIKWYELISVHLYCGKNFCEFFIFDKFASGQSGQERWKKKQKQNKNKKHDTKITFFQ